MNIIYEVISRSKNIGILKYADTGLLIEKIKMKYIIVSPNSQHGVIKKVQI